MIVLNLAAVMAISNNEPLFIILKRNNSEMSAIRQALWFFDVHYGLLKSLSSVSKRTDYSLHNTIDV